MDNDKLKDLMANIKPEDLHVDSKGRVVIENEQLATDIAELGAVKKPSLDEAAWNGICCGDSNCGGEGKLMGFLDRITQGAGRRGGS